MGELGMSINYETFCEFQRTAIVSVIFYYMTINSLDSVDFQNCPAVFAERYSRQFFLCMLSAWGPPVDPRKSDEFPWIVQQFIYPP